MVGWVDEFEQWRAGAVKNVVLHLRVFDGELGYVGHDGAWAITHIQDGAVTPLLVGAPETLWAKRPRTWEGRAHVPVPAVVLGGVRSTFAPIWGRTLLGVARDPGGRVIALGIVGEQVGMAVLVPEPVLVFVGRPQEIGTVNLDHLDWLTRPTTAKAKPATISTTASPTASTSRIGAPPTCGMSATPLQVTQHFDRVRAAMSRASHSRRWSVAARAEIPRVIDALERWAREGRGSMTGRRRTLHAALAAASSDFRVSLDGFSAALVALGQVCGDFVTPASRQSRSWHINMDRAVFEGHVVPGRPRRATSVPRRSERAVEAERPREGQVEDERGEGSGVGEGRSFGEALDVEGEDTEDDVVSLFRPSQRR